MLFHGLSVKSKLLAHKRKLASPVTGSKSLRDAFVYKDLRSGKVVLRIKRIKFFYKIRNIRPAVRSPGIRYAGVRNIVKGA